LQHEDNAQVLLGIAMYVGKLRSSGTADDLRYLGSCLRKIALTTEHVCLPQARLQGPSQIAD
jgi:hypothetical protein